MGNSKLGMETKALTEGAVMAALTVILALASVYLPIIGTFTYLVWTLPVVAMCLRHSFKAGLISMAAAGLIIMMLTSPLIGLGLIIACAFPALVLGLGLKNKWSTARILLLTALATIIGMAVSYGLDAIIAGIPLVKSFTAAIDVMEESFGSVTTMYQEMGMLESMGMTAEQFTKEIESAFVLLRYIFPAIFLVSGFGVAYVNYMLANFVLKRLKMELPPVTGFSRYRLPFWCIWIFIFLFAGFLGLSYAGYAQTVLRQIFGNALLFVSALYMLQALAVIWSWVNGLAKRWRVLIKVLIVIYLFNGNILLYGLLVLAGIIDVFKDFRKLDAEVEID